MPRRSVSAAPLLSLSLLALLGLGCAQGEGERCQIDSDCKSGLTCQNLGNSLFTGNGTCRSTASKSTGDASVKQDTATSPRPDSAIPSDALSRDVGDARLSTDATDATDARTATDAIDARSSADGRSLSEVGMDVPVPADAHVDAAQAPDASSDVQTSADDASSQVD